ncbi:Pex30p [Sugiyamaella lignohabitans]|uniref:Pex30p n=1 Tax=Sugiyamaella lignohabitans TaxID=796027 RepID=A0A167D974_9ASCO|nr:Pex30p [Sugiyamaella lignohabitans]ANB12634.1 Pex30p [Sugiyamaella lignohabitans]
MAAIESNFVMSSSSTTADSTTPSSNTEASSSGLASSSQKNASGTGAAVPTYATFTPPRSSLPQHTSPLLSSTPPSVTKALSQAYPLILAVDRFLSLLTWTGDDAYQSFLLVAAWSGLVLYFEFIVRYLGHMILVGLIATYTWVNKEVEKQQAEHPTLDSIIHSLNTAVTRLDLFLLPVTSLRLSPHDVSRLVFTTLFMTPIYVTLTLFIVTPRTVLLLLGIFVLTYHSVWARVTRSILWRWRLVHVLSFYVTGIDFNGVSKPYGSEAQFAMASDKAKSASSTAPNKPVRFTYVLYENQRRWLGIGWTSNLLGYERAAWSDEFLNESPPPSSFKLPEADGSGMTWRWVDKTWRLDLTNDGALVVNGGKTSKVDPGPNEGYIYYDNVWKKPTAEDSYSKYTRRRRWIRTAELIAPGNTIHTDDSLGTSPGDASTEDSSTTTDSTDEPSSTVKQRKSIRFEDN